MEIKVTNQNEQLVIKKLAELDDKVVGACARAMQRGLLGAVAKAQLEYLSGPRPGKIQSISGRLRMGMNSSITISSDGVTGNIGNNVKYAAFHEFGFHGVVNVRAHSRVISQTTQGRNSLESYADSTRSTRKRANSLDGEFLGFMESRKRASGRQRTGFVGVQFVKAHQRKVDYAGKPFTRPALEAMTPFILEEINTELKALK